MLVTGKRTTLSDIAKEVGVSAATVSLALQNDSRISDERRQEVQAAARRLGYHPQLAGRLLRANRTGQLGLILTGGTRTLLSDLGFYGPTQAAFVDECETLGVGYHIEMAPLDEGGVVPLPRQLAGGMVDGALVAGYCPAELTQVLESSGKPWVSVWEPGLYSVCANSRGCARMAVQHLAALGHRRIGLVTGPTRYHTHQTVQQGFREALVEFHLEERAEWQLETKELSKYPTGVHIAALVDGLLCLPVRPTAIVCNGIDMAHILIFRGLELGLHVPGDFSVFCTGSRADAGGNYPRLTRVQMPVVDMVTQAIDMLRRRINGTTIRDHHVSLDPTFVEGETVAPAPAIVLPPHPTPRSSP